MPIDVVASENRRWLYARIRGAVHEADLIRYLEKMEQMDDGASGDVAELVDTSAMTGCTVDERALRRIVEIESAQRRRPLRRAIVAGGSHAFWLADRYAEMAAQAQITAIVFNEIGVAATWLGVDRSLVYALRHSDP